jgi:hypothetical protein
MQRMIKTDNINNIYADFNFKGCDYSSIYNQENLEIFQNDKKAKVQIIDSPPPDIIKLYNLKNKKNEKTVIKRILGQKIAENLKKWLNFTPEEREQYIDGLVQIKEISSTDSRTELHGQCGTFAVKEIKAGTVLFPYTGRYCDCDSLTNLFFKFGMDDINRYAFDVEAGIFISGCKEGGIANLINANTTYNSDQDNW